jgi:DNA-binding MarR family transcriptional regulator
MPKNKEEGLDPLEAIKRLLILDLIYKGVSLQAIGDAIGVDKSTVSRMVPQGKLKKVK